MAYNIRKLWNNQYNDMLHSVLLIESTKTTSMEDVSTGVLEKKIKNI